MNGQTSGVTGQRAATRKGEGAKIGELRDIRYLTTFGGGT